MSSLFSSLLSPALKEKLGMRTKDKPRKVAAEKKPLSSHNSSTLRRLPEGLATEVQSPGFASRLSNLVRDDPPGAERLSPRYSLAGFLPRVQLKPRVQPSLSSRSSTKLGRGRVILRMAPAEPYSPFKRRISSESLARSRQGEQEKLSTDPRSVIAMLAELSGKRNRRSSDENSETGSKRARRDSSSSLGSSLSMEMPPLFSSGVVGQTTSHLVSRETDLSLGSLLSRNQSVFGPSSSGLGGNVGVSSSSGAGPNQNPRSRSVNAELLASLSSSRCMLKRARDFDSDSDSDSEVETPRVKKANIFRSPDLGKGCKNSSRQSSRKSSEGSPEKTVLERTENTTSTPAVDTAPVLVLPTPEEIISTPTKRAGDQARMVSREDLDQDRKLQRKRLDKMLAVFGDEIKKFEPTPSLDKEASAQRTAESTAATGGFPFTFGKDGGGKQPQKDAPGFSYEFGAKKKDAEHIGTEKTTTVTFSFGENKPPEGSSNIDPTKEITEASKPTETSTHGILKKPAEANSPKVSSGLNFGSAGEEKSELSATQDKSGITHPAEATVNPEVVDKPSSTLPAPSFTFGGFKASPATQAGGPTVVSSVHSGTQPSVLTSTQPAVQTSTESTSTQPPAYSFGISTAKSTADTASVSVFSFGKAAETTSAGSTLPAVNKPPVFSFGSIPAASAAAPPSDLPASLPPPAYKPESSSTLAAPVFSFGAAKPSNGSEKTAFSFGAALAPSSSAGTTASASSTAAAPTFSFGASKPGAAAGAAFQFGGDSAAPGPASSSSFSFGGKAAATATTTAAASTTPFQFGTAAAAITTQPSTGTAPSFPTFQFGAAPSQPAASAAAPTSTAGPNFQFGAASTARSAGSAAFQFGGSGALVASSSSAAATPSYQFGGATTTKAATAGPPSFSFGSTAAQSNGGATPFTLGSAKDLPAIAASSGPFQFGKTDPKPGFNFGSTAPAAEKSSYAFGGASSTGSSVFGGANTNTGGSLFGGIKPSQTPSFGSTSTGATFGSSSSNLQGTAASTFGSTSNLQAGNVSFGGIQNSGSTFGAAQLPAGNLFGSSSFSAPNPQSALNIFSFGKTESKPAVASVSPFAFGTSAPSSTITSGSGAFVFGASQSAPKSAPTFQFGGSGGGSSSAAPAQFGAPVANSAPAPTPTSGGGLFQFGATSPAQPSAAQAFGFGAALAQPAQPGVFQFGSAPAPNANPFGNTGSTSQFGAPAPSFNSPAGTFGAPAPSFGGPAPGGNMFSIGAGSSQASRPGQPPRKYATARRNRK